MPDASKAELTFTDGTVRLEGSRPFVTDLVSRFALGRNARGPKHA